MPWLPLYLLDSDIDVLNNWLNKDEEVYFVQQVNRSQWKLVKEMQIKKDDYYNKYRLWHLPSGQIPLIRKRDPLEGFQLLETEQYEYVANPFEPWSGTPCGNLSELPFFGDDESKVFTLTIHNPDNPLHPIPISGMEWQGNYYKMIGKEATEASEKWWKRLRAFVKKNSIQIPRSNDPSMKNEIFAFPIAMEAIKKGRECAMN